MIGRALSRGERPGVLGWGGMAVALAGLLGLTWPGLAAPDPRGAALMALAGAARGV
jgi:drug/metabolite transporter (DMT)-like permease